MNERYNTEPINGSCPACEGDLFQDNDGSFFCPNCGEMITDKDTQIRLLQEAIRGEQELRDETAAALYKAKQEINRLRADFPDGRIVETIPYKDGSIFIVVRGDQAEQAYNSIRAALINGPWVTL